MSNISLESMNNVQGASYELTVPIVTPSVLNDAHYVLMVRVDTLII